MQAKEAVSLPRLAVVTGGSRGIGHAIVLEAARCGYDVVFTYRDRVSADGTEQQAAAEGLSVHGVAVCLDNRASITRFADEIAEGGRVGLLVNSAGVILGGDLSNVNDDDWEVSLAVNVTAPFILSRALAPSLRMNDGAIINISSNGGIAGSMLGSPYGTTKAAILGLTRTLAKELAPEVRVNAVAPGTTASDMYASLTEDQRVAFEENIPLRRVALPAEIAQVVMDVAKWRYVTGQTIVVDGGAVMH